MWNIEDLDENDRRIAEHMITERLFPDSAVSDDEWDRFCAMIDRKYSG